MAKNSRHRWAVLFSKVYNAPINDFPAVTSYRFTVAMEEREFYISAHRNDCSGDQKDRTVFTILEELGFSHRFPVRVWALKNRLLSLF